MYFKTYAEKTLPISEVAPIGAHLLLALVLLLLLGGLLLLRLLGGLGGHLLSLLGRPRVGAAVGLVLLHRLVILLLHLDGLLFPFLQRYFRIKYLFGESELRSTYGLVLQSAPQLTASLGDVCHLAAGIVLLDLFAVLIQPEHIGRQWALRAVSTHICCWFGFGFYWSKNDGWTLKQSVKSERKNKGNLVELQR